MLDAGCLTVERIDIIWVEVQNLLKDLVGFLILFFIDHQFISLIEELLDLNL
jgi:hypothetical protein